MRAPRTNRCRRESERQCHKLRPVSFFDVPPRPPEPPPRPRPDQPEWLGPPKGMLPGVSTQEVVLFKTDRAFLRAHRFLAYPTGIQFTLNLRLRSADDHDHDLHWDLHGRRRPGRSEDDLLRLGVLWSDGAKRTNLDSTPPGRNTPPEPPVVMSRSGGGGDGQFSMTYWMWPLPPEGPMTIVCEWPAYDIAETRVVVDATELRSRADEAEAIWPD